MLTSLLCLVSKDYCRQWWSCQAARDLLLNVCELNAHVIKINDTDVTNHVCFLRRAQFRCIFSRKVNNSFAFKTGHNGWNLTRKMKQLLLLLLGLDFTNLVGF